MNPRPRHDLIDLALGRLAPEDRERLEREVRTDEALRREAEAVRRHLGRWDALPPPPPTPPALRVLGRLGEAPARRVPVLAVAGGLGLAAASLVVAFLVAGSEVRRTSPAAWLQAHRLVPGAGVGVETSRDGTPLALVADAPARVDLGPRGTAVLDQDARLAPGPGPDDLHLSGRAWFDVSVPLAVVTDLGTARVLGTRFEVDAPPAGALVVRVEEGQVGVGDVVVPAGRQVAGGAVGPLDAEVGAWWRRPRLALEGPSEARRGEPLPLVLVLTNPTRLPQEIGLGDGVRAGLWVSIEPPSGGGIDRAVPETDALGAPLAPGETRRVEVRLPEAFGEAGRHRLSAMYRPSDGPPLLSAPLVLEVR
jgi:ferric-dicitrate binding protein FerR (iron transport regulator)